MSTDVHVVLCTFPDADEAHRIARAVIAEHLAACVNVLPEARSIYRWDGRVRDEPETVAILKTTTERLDALRARIVSLHPYDCPEWISLDVAGGHVPYLDWVAAAVHPPSAP